MQSFDLYPVNQHKAEIYHKCKHVTVDQFVDLISDGDLIFSRSNSFEGSLIQISGHCIWNHISMCFFKHWCEATNSDMIYPLVSIENQNKPTGVKLWSMRHGLKSILTQNPGILILGVSKFTSKASKTSEYVQKMWNFWKKEQGKPYTSNYSVLFFSWFDSWSSLKNLCCWQGVQDTTEQELQQSFVFKNSKTTKDYFCSQIVAECLKEAGVMIPNYIESTEWTVADFANMLRLGNNLCNNFKYEEIEFYSVRLSE